MIKEKYAREKTVDHRDLRNLIFGGLLKVTQCLPCTPCRFIKRLKNIESHTSNTRTYYYYILFRIL